MKAAEKKKTASTPRWVMDVATIPQRGKIVVLTDSHTRKAVMRVLSCG